jgi:hypothetical protein
MTTSTLPSAGSAIITLDRIERTPDGKLLAPFSAGKRAWSIELAGRHLNSFSAFRAHVADSIGLRTDHESQGGFRARDRDEAWEAAVSDAFIAGAAK